MSPLKFSSPQILFFAQVPPSPFPRLFWSEIFRWSLKLGAGGLLPCLSNTPLYPKIFFLWGGKFFSCLVARDWEDFKFLWDLLYWGDLISFLEEAGILIENFNLIGNFLAENFLSVHVSIETFKSVYYCLIITLWKCEYCLIWALSKSILFGTKSLTVLVLCDMNSEKSFLL